MTYVLQLVPEHPAAWRFMVTWPGYWAGCGYVENPKDALKFRSRKQASLAMWASLPGLNGLLAIRKLEK